MASKTNQKFVLIDSNALIHRAFHALPPLTSPEGKMINAVYGFLTILFKILSELKPNYLACAFDYPARTFRHKKFKDYKAHRKKTPPELAEQIKKTKEVVEILKIPIFEKEGYEADDIIASLSRKLSQNKDLEIIIVTGDLDELQLVKPKIKVFTMRKGFSDTVLYDEKEVFKKFNLKPSQLLDFKALRGDASDNIPGVPGIGEKTAISLIKEYQNLEKLYQNLNQLSEKIRNLLINYKEQAFLSKNLAQLIDNLPLFINLKKCLVTDFNRQEVKDLFNQMGFKSLIKRLFGEKEEKLVHEKAQSTQLSLLKKIENNHKVHSLTLDKALEPILKKMEERGFLLDIPYLQKINRKVTKDLEKIAHNIYQKVGHEFNINSPQQLAYVLFEELKLPTIKKIKTGYSTDQAVLSELINYHPVVGLILNYREIFKIKSTYLDSLPKLVDEKNRIHTHFTQDTSSGRLASRDPNLQNIPIKGELGQKIRKAFIAPQGYLLLSADYSQIELRIIASLSEDQNMIKAFKLDKDIHSQTAAEIFNKKIDEVDTEERRIAKTVNFGIIYGMGAHGLAQTLKISYEEADAYIQKYFSIYPGVLNYINKIKKEARNKGYVETLFGRRRYLPEISSEYSRFQKAAERIAINMPIQGTAADLIKLAMIKIDQKIDNLPFKVFLILQIHDELIFEVPEGKEKEVSQLVKTEMEKVYQLKVPIKAEISTGKNWGELK